MRFKYYFILAFTFFLLVSVQIIETFKGKVVGITDGDSITVLTDDSVSVKIRLNGIDCPEKNQAFGTKAKQFSSDLVFGKSVKVHKTGIDKYGRTLGDVVLADTISLSKELLKAGLAWHYKKYNTDPELAQLEQEAKAAKKGLWIDSLPVAPWDFRHGTGNVTLQQNGGSNNTNIDAGNQTKSEQNDNVNYKGNVIICNSSSSYAYHKYQCSGADKCRSGMSVISVDKAKSMGRTPCKICKW